MDLNEFLTARLDQDEYCARVVTRDDWGDGDEDGWERHEWEDLPERAFGHAKRHSPTRVLAEVAAKRRIIHEHRIGFDPCDAHNASFESVPCETMRLLALPFADHPDYRPEWAPDTP